MQEYNPLPVIFDTREEWLVAFMEAAKPVFLEAGHPIPLNTRVSVGFTSNGYKSNAVGECWMSEASSDGHFEIFINPTTQTDARIADIFTHELCHAALATTKHDKQFGNLARALGLDGKLTATVAGSEWYRWAAPILDSIGAMPYGEIKANMQPPKPKKATFTLKTYCPQCGWLARVTKRHIESHSYLNCPVPDCDGQLVTEF
jgi:hypothetical protein